MVRYAVLKGFYEIEKTIGCGGFAKVKLATHVATGEKVAIKIMDKAALHDDLARVKLELEALKTLSHHHICKLYQVIETEAHYFIVIEYCSGGELFDHIVEKNRLNETESRMFFRQIVSAVAYLHSLGYAHRDLKPENVLLDCDKNLKLIDFGLCAKPQGGMQSPLFTSCGSPTYAAPELVQGKQYLGTEVDVWAMGVLLYALLAGFLPFDDDNIDNLYKKILTGKYTEPSFMSTGSKQLIRQMLQVDPKKRITINEMLSHPWLTLGVLGPVDFTPENCRSYNNDCVSVMASYHGVGCDEMWSNLKKWKYDYDTATYFLLLTRKKKGLPLKLSSAATKLPVRAKSADAIKTLKSKAVQNENKLKPSHKSDSLVTEPKPSTSKDVPSITVTAPRRSLRTLRERTANKSKSDKTEVTPHKSDDISSPSNFTEPRKPSSIRKGQKRIRSPNLEGDCSPVPAKKATPGRKTPRTPERKRMQLRSDTPGSARRVLGTIERSLNRVRNVLTPKKPTADAPQHPIMLTSKDLLNVSTTQCSDPEFVICELVRALQKKDIHCDRKGFRLRGKIEPNAIHRVRSCSFELEICYLPSWGSLPDSTQFVATPPPKSILKNGALLSGTPPMRSAELQKYLHKKINQIDPDSFNGAKVGIRRKRLKGDSWCYKKVCEQVLALTSTEFKQPTESCV